MADANPAIVRPTARHLVTGEPLASGSAGRPKFLGIERVEGVGIVASWADGSLAVATFVNGHLAGWKPLASPDYDALFTESVQDEMRCMHADCRAVAPADSTVCPKCFRVFR